METDLTIVAITNSDPNFYQLMGPFLARRPIAKELGGSLYDDDQKVWFVASRLEVVVGWCAALPERDGIRFCSAYVLPEYRRAGVYRSLIAARDTTYSGITATAVCTPASVPALAAAGMTPAGSKGAFTRMTRVGGPVQTPGDGVTPDVQVGETSTTPTVPQARMSADLVGADIADRAEKLFAELAVLPDGDRIDAINDIRLALHQYSPQRREPVDCVLWVDPERVHGNSYNPNTVAPPEMDLLKLSIMSDGYTQPIVTWEDGDGYEVVDGFHRHLIGKRVDAVRKRTGGRLPVSVINGDRTSQEDRVASTIRHNRARGVHQVDAMSEIVLDLMRQGKADEWIGAHLGMEPDEVLRLKQVSGLADLFADRNFSEAWEPDRH